MSRRDGVEITGTGESFFGRFYDMTPLRRDGLHPDAIIVAVQKGGFQPVRLMLPHQLYEHTAKQILEEHGASELWVIPIQSADWTHVRLTAASLPDQRLPVTRLQDHLISIRQEVGDLIDSLDEHVEADDMGTALNALHLHITRALEDLR